jgi:hypothetical protein
MGKKAVVAYFNILNVGFTYVTANNQENSQLSAGENPVEIQTGLPR